MELQTFNNTVLNCKVDCQKAGEAIWFKAKDIATWLGYTNTRQAVLVNVDADDKYKLDELRVFYSVDYP